jgi:hypothetical protein
MASLPPNSALPTQSTSLRRRWSDDELCKPAKVFRDCRQCELELSASRPAQPQTTEPKDALEMCKQHLNTFAIAARSFECFGLGQPSGDVTRFLIDAALESAQRRLWTSDLRRQLRQSRVPAR